MSDTWLEDVGLAESPIATEAWTPEAWAPDSPFAETEAFPDSWPEFQLEAGEMPFGEGLDENWLEDGMAESPFVDGEGGDGWLESPFASTLAQAGRPGGSTAGGQLVLPAGSTIPELVLKWNAMTAPTWVDIVVHFHGNNTTRARVRVVDDLLPISGLDFADPDNPGASGLTRPTLAILPRGKYIESERFRFPSLLVAGGLDKLIDDCVLQLTAATGLEVKRRRLVLTAHSGGGYALEQILGHTDADEVHCFDAFYPSPRNLVRWALGHIEKDKATNEPFRRSGALRALYRDEGTGANMRRVQAALCRALVGTTGLGERYRIEWTSTRHCDIPRRYGWRLLADPNAILPDTKLIECPRPRRPEASNPEATSRTEYFAGEDEVEVPAEELDYGWGGEDLGAEYSPEEAGRPRRRARDADADPLSEAEDQAGPQVVTDALVAKDWPGALKAAIENGWRDHVALTNLVFFARHPELNGRALDPKNAKDARLAKEWARIHNREVVPAIGASAQNRDLVVSGTLAAAWLPHFWGARGAQFKSLVEWAAQEVDIDPALLATALLSETGRTRSYLTSGKVSSYHIGTDDFYQRRAALESKVKAYKDVRWDRSQMPATHNNDAQTKPRPVKTINFNSGRDATLATAVYLKYGEVVLREAAAARGKDFDALPVETRFALTRIAMAAGPGGGKKYLGRVLDGQEILDRRNLPPKAYRTLRNATIRAAQALFLSGWIFNPPPFPAPLTAPGPTPEAEVEVFEAGANW